MRKSRSTSHLLNTVVDEKRELEEEEWARVVVDGGISVERSNC